MKQYLIFMVVFYLQAISYGQTQVDYLYDNSGNRTSRRTIILSKSLIQERDSTKNEEKITEQIEDKTILVYPNPVREEVNIEITGIDENIEGSIYLFDEGGRLLITASQISTRNTFNLARYPTGIYFLIIRLGNNKTKYTIIKN